MRLPDPEDQPTLTIWPEAGRALGISRSAAYSGAASGEIPTIRIGRRVLVPTAALRNLLQMDGRGGEAGESR